jgi:predicted metal-binding protein
MTVDKEVEQVAQQVAELKVAEEAPKTEEKAAEVEVEVDVIVDGPTLEAPKKLNEKKLAKIVKAGGKRGVEIEGAADMGGLQFFCTKLDEPAANMFFTMEAIKAMNARSDPTEEERKGGAGKIGKIVMSATETACSLIAYCPKDKADKAPADEWLKQVVVDCVGGSEKKFEECGLEIKTYEGIEGKYWASCMIDNCPDKELFVMKFKDAIISYAYTFLKKRDLFPEDDESDDECCWGDDDFDCCQ